MQLASDIVVNKRKEEVWSFLADPENVAKWDRSVKAVEPGKPTPYGPETQTRYILVSRNVLAFGVTMLLEFSYVADSVANDISEIDNSILRQQVFILQQKLLIDHPGHVR